MMPFVARWMQRDILILGEVSQREEEKHHMISLRWESKTEHKRTYLQNETDSPAEQKQTHRHSEQTRSCQGGGGGWMGRLGLGDANCYR